MLLSVGVFLVAIQLSYTRAAYVAVFLAIISYFIVKWRLMKIALIVASIAAVVGLSFLARNNTYLDFAPNYETTIAHTNFDNLIEATYQFEDISTMERVYRWIAGFNMIHSEPLHGFGPGNFYFFYKSFTVQSFETYVSDNPEKSGIHNYFLMLTVEQGIPGLLIFLVLVFYMLIRGEQIYHLATSKEDRWIILTSILSILVILALSIINDLIETDKVGPVFFICAALIVNQDLKLLQISKRKRSNETTS